ncbi:DUF938 domain-containing protein [Robiginitomaculum antarcticum]|uniref:DUF938 domain-containing protein n=1 Tax=Robiginitomaculum antarcticum TaxID=437507 RepID=UPI000360EAD3|nr:DUF938 domain-containing protein [Robiginitomaculum antarcticum]
MSDKPVHLEDRTSEGARLFSPTAARNCGPIADIIAPQIKPGQCVLEIASGTGQQAMAIIDKALDIYWQPSDPDAASRASVKTYIEAAPLRLLDPLNIDVTQPNWWAALPRTYDHMFCANMIHIAPAAALHGLAKGAGELLPPGGNIWLYGPFLFGDDSAQSNLTFNDRLKQRDPAWGVRELDFVKPIFANAGLDCDRVTAMPANNHIICLKKP